MKYFIKSQGSPAIVGPYSIEEIEAWLETGELSRDDLATVDTGERPEKAIGWLCLHQLPGVGGNPPMSCLDGEQAPSSQSPPPLLPPPKPSDNLSRKPAESLSPAAKKPTAPHPLLVLLVLMPSGLLVHFVSFIFVCAMCAMFGGGHRTPSGLLVLVAVVHSVVWIAIAIPMRRDPTNRGVAFGIIIGLCLTGLLTGSCASK